MPACPNGATPNTTGLAQDLQWIGWDLVSSAVAAPLEEIAPWLPAAYAPFLQSASNICASNPELPAQITPQDLFGAAVDHMFGMSLPSSFIDKVNAIVNYEAFNHLCQCNGSPTTTPPPPNTLGGTCAIAFEFQVPLSDYPAGTQIAGFLTFDAASPTSGTGPIWYNRISTRPGSPNNFPDCTQLPQSLGFQIPLHPLTDSCGRTYYQQLILTSSTPSPDDSYPYRAQFWSAGPTVTMVNPVILWTPCAGFTPPPNTAPVSPTIPTAPPLACDTNTLCGIQWNIVYQTSNVISANQNNTTQILSNEPSSYVTGNSHTLSGSGKQAVAADILGLAIQFVDVPSSSPPTQTDPPRYYDVGWIAFAAADALEQKRWMHSSGERFMPVFPEVDSFYFNLGPGWTITFTELVAPPPS